MKSEAYMDLGNIRRIVQQLGEEREKCSAFSQHTHVKSLLEYTYWHTLFRLLSLWPKQPIK